MSSSTTLGQSAETTTRKLWREILGPKAKDPSTGILSIGVGLKRIARLSEAIEAELGVSVPTATLMRIGTLDSLVQAVQTGIFPAQSSCILLKDGDERPPIYVLSGGSGILLDVIEVVKAIDYPGQIWGLQLPGLDGEAEPLTDIPTMGEFYAAMIAARHLQGCRCNMIGYSFGGSVVIEAARCLSAAGHKMGLIGLIDSNLDEKNWPSRAWLGHVLKRCLGTVAKAINMRPREQAQYLVTRATRLVFYVARRATGEQTPSIENSAYYVGGLERYFQRVRDASIVAYQNYVPRRLDLTVTLFRSELRYAVVCNPAAVWRPYIRRLQVVQVTGSHVTMVRLPHAKKLAAEITARL